MKCYFNLRIQYIGIIQIIISVRIKNTEPFKKLLDKVLLKEYDGNIY